MKSLIEKIIVFAQVNPNTAMLLGIATVGMIIVTVLAFANLFPMPRYAKSDDVKSSVVTAVLTVLFIAGVYIAFAYAPTLVLSDTGAQIVGVFITIYALMVWRFKNTEVWTFGFFGFF